MCLYSPYFGTAYGGGEKYLGETACLIRDRFPSCEVEILSPVPVDLRRYEEVLGLDLSGIRTNTTNARPGSWKRRLARVSWLRPLRDLAITLQACRQASGADLFVHMVYRLPVFAAGRRRVLLVQFPHETRAAGRVLAHALRVLTGGCAGAPYAAFDRVVCQSEYVRRWTRRLAGVDAAVVHPPISVPDTAPDWAGKEKRILTVGRFIAAGHHKRQDLLVREFRRLVDEGLTDWRLDVVGSVQADDPEDVALLDEVRGLAAGYPVGVHVGIPEAELRALYARSSLYWHAAGYGTDPDRHPADVEHFGMTTAEAMAHGTVPVAIRAGGQPEVVEDGASGYLWSTLEELRERTLRLTGDAALREQMGVAAWARSAAFSRERFRERMAEVLAPLVAGAG